MSTLDEAARIVHAVAMDAGDVSGNLDAADRLIGRPGCMADALQQLEWAADNARHLQRRINDALVTVKRLVDGGAA